MLIDLITGKNVALVGPSSFLDNKNMGKLIDTFDIVIKINRFEDLLPKDHGKKVDILFHNFSPSIPDKSIANCNTKLIVTTRSFRDESTKKKNDQIKNIIRSEKINKIPHEFYPIEELPEDMENFITGEKDDEKIYRKTAGLWIIGLLFSKINIIKQLGIFGIDFLFNDYNKKYNPENYTTHHNMELELSLFKKMFQNYKENEKIIIYDKDFFMYLTS